MMPAEILEPFRVLYDEPDESAAAKAEQAERCRELYAAGLMTYWRDARAVARGKPKIPPDGGEAWRDLHSDKRLLAALCDPVGASVERVAAAILESVANA